MTDIEIVIRIPEEIYKASQILDVKYEDTVQIPLEAIANGTPLSKGHGDLKDMDDIYEALEGWNDDTGWIVDAIDCQAPTIIKADNDAISEDELKSKE